MSQRIVAILAGLLLLGGCNNNTLPPSQQGPVPNTTVSGALNGQFLSYITATYTNKNGINRTKFAISAGPIPEMNITSFVVTANLTGMPAALHYGEREGQITADFFMGDDRIFQETVNSLLAIDIGSVSEPVGNPDGTASYTLSGTASGWLGAIDTSEVVRFIVVF